MYRIGAGLSYPLGASVTPEGVNFSIFAQYATAVELLLFDDVNDARPSHVIILDAAENTTFYYWHVFVHGLKPDQIYAYRVYGPNAPELGLRFDSDKVLIDPYGLAIAVPDRYDRKSAARPGDTAATAMKSVIVDCRTYDWEGDRPLHRSFGQTVFYELHVRGFTQHPNSGISDEKRGTYAGLIEKIPYLQELGITAVELLPVFQFDEQDSPDGLSNYWGYSPVSFFAPHRAYSSRTDLLGPLDEFRDMVKALHLAGIEVILDVVFNHTAEGDETGPTFSFRGLGNPVYYILEEDRRRYANFSGTGNTLNATNSIVRRMILDSLRYWVREMHVDGFRFDLASILARDEGGELLENPPTLWAIESDPTLAGAKLIAEPWDAAGLYQVGSFVGERWKEWNGRFRDDIRSFFKGDTNTVATLPSRLLGSPDLYSRVAREPEQSINFVTCHDGFTLNDLVSYNEKHNEANREGGHDGQDYNLSWNSGVEGPTDDPYVEAIRNRQVKNFLTVTLLSVGAPMLLMGDEVRRTQRGNNNAYCQDNEISWFDWSLLDDHADILHFTRMLIQMRLHLDAFNGKHGMSLEDLLRRARIQWHGVELNKPDWSENSHSLAVTIQGFSDHRLFHIILNAYWEPLEFQLPTAPENLGGEWRLFVDTYRNVPESYSFKSDLLTIQAPTYLVHDRSVVVLAASANGRI